MEKCECWHCGTCLGTKECEECSCYGDPAKCDFYPEKRKEKKMTTLEMMNQAAQDGKTYKAEDMRYNVSLGFHDNENKKWNANAFDYINDIFAINYWQVKPDNEMTKSEAEAKFNIKIIGD